MRKIATLISGGAVLAALASPALAQVSSTATASGSVTIVQPITITKNNDLTFGTIVKPSTGTATVAINGSTGQRTVTGTVAANNTGAGRAVFTVSGEGAQHFSITVAPSFSMTSGGNSLVVTTSNPTGATGPAQRLGGIHRQPVAGRRRLVQPDQRDGFRAPTPATSW